MTNPLVVTGEGTQKLAPSGRFGLGDHRKLGDPLRLGLLPPKHSFVCKHTEKSLTCDPAQLIPWEIFQQLDGAG